MSESQAQKKKNKTKKKQEGGEAPNSMEKDAKNSTVLEPDCNKNVSHISNSKTLDTFIEAVMDNKNKVSDESAGKKKKKSKKKSKDSPKETASENNNSESLLNYSEKGIHLVNHPEISVTIAESAKDNEIKTVADEIPQLDEKKPVNESNLPADPSTDTGNNTNAAKKNKKKKKKKNNNDNLPPTSAASNEDSVPTPTYTKVVTSDNTCVLVVNNENFSTSAKSVEKAENLKNKMPDSNISFSMPSEKPLGSVLVTKNFTPDTNIQFSNTVSIFPVLTNGTAATSINETNMSASLEKNLNAEAQLNDSSSQENTGEPMPTKSQLKAERRAKQEAQRAAKLAKNNANVSNPATNENKNITSKEKTAPKEKSSKESVSKIEATNETPVAKLSNEKESLHKVKLFSHLPQSKKFDINAKIHPAMLEMGFQYYKGTICGSNARCIALLQAFVEVIKDYTPHPDRNFCRDLESNIQSYVSFLNNCRPLSVSMMNAIRFLKHEINQIPSDMEIDEIKDRLCDFIFNFVKVEIVLAKEAIANRSSYKIVDGDVILILGFSSVIRDVLCKAHEMKKVFKVVVVDTRPKLEGLKMLRHLVKQGLQCSYISINAVSYIMKEVTKFIIGAHAVLANGCVMSRLGNKQIALVASTYGVPVFVCCETYKFSERVLTDPFVHNELGEPEDIIATSLIFNDSLKNWHDLPLLQPLNLLYDLTTPNLIAEIVTEKGTLPCTSVPVFLRMRFAGMTQ